MANNKAIQLLRGDREGLLANKDEVLLAGQPLYNKDDNQLSIGDGTTTVENLKPISVRELHGYFADDNGLSDATNSEESYSIKSASDNTLEISAPTIKLKGTIKFDNDPEDEGDDITSTLNQISALQSTQVEQGKLITELTNKTITDINESIASLQQESTANSAALRQVAENISGYTSIDIWDEDKANTDIIYKVKEDNLYHYFYDSEWKSTEDPYEAGCEITAASIVTAVNGDTSGIKLSADRVDIEGVVTFINKAGAETTIDGGKITTNSITIGSLNTELTSKIVYSITNDYLCLSKDASSPQVDDTRWTTLEAAEAEWKKDNTKYNVWEKTSTQYHDDSISYSVRLYYAALGEKGEAGNTGAAGVNPFKLSLDKDSLIIQTSSDNTITSATVSEDLNLILNSGIDQINFNDALLNGYKLKFTCTDSVEDPNSNLTSPYLIINTLSNDTLESIDLGNAFGTTASKIQFKVILSEEFKSDSAVHSADLSIQLLDSDNNSILATTSLPVRKIPAGIAGAKGDPGKDAVITSIVSNPNTIKYIPNIRKFDLSEVIFTFYNRVGNSEPELFDLSDENNKSIYSCKIKQVFNDNNFEDLTSEVSEITSSATIVTENLRTTNIDFINTQCYLLCELYYGDFVIANSQVEILADAPIKHLGDYSNRFEMEAQNSTLNTSNQTIYNIYVNNTYRDIFEGITYIYKAPLGSAYDSNAWEKFSEDGVSNYQVHCSDTNIIETVVYDKIDTEVGIDKTIQIELYKASEGKLTLTRDAVKSYYRCDEYAGYYSCNITTDGPTENIDYTFDSRNLTITINQLKATVSKIKVAFYRSTELNDDQTSLKDPVLLDSEIISVQKNIIGDPGTYLQPHWSASKIKRILEEDPENSGVIKYRYEPESIQLSIKEIKGAITSLNKPFQYRIDDNSTLTSSTADGNDNIVTITFDSTYDNKNSFSVYFYTADGKTLIDSESFPIITDGESAYILDTDNDYIQIPCDSDGNIRVDANNEAIWEEAISNISFSKDNIELHVSKFKKCASLDDFNNLNSLENNNYDYEICYYLDKVVVNPDTITDLNPDGVISSKQVTITGLKADLGYIRLKAFAGTKLVATHSVSLAKQKSGADSVRRKLIADPSIITRLKTGALSANNITLQLVKEFANGVTELVENWSLDLPGNNNHEDINNGKYTYTIEGEYINHNSFDFKAYVKDHNSDDVIVDILTVSVVNDGKDGSGITMRGEAYLDTNTSFDNLEVGETYYLYNKNADGILSPITTTSNSTLDSYYVRNDLDTPENVEDDRLHYFIYSGKKENSILLFTYAGLMGNVPGKDGRGVASHINLYCYYNSDTTYPELPKDRNDYRDWASSLNDAAKKAEDKGAAYNYFWDCELIIYTDGTITISEPQCHGNSGNLNEIVELYYLSDKKLTDDEISNIELPIPNNLGKTPTEASNWWCKDDLPLTTIDRKYLYNCEYFVRDVNSDYSSLQLIDNAEKTPYSIVIDNDTIVVPSNSDSTTINTWGGEIINVYLYYGNQIQSIEEINPSSINAGEYYLYIEKSADFDISIIKLGNGQYGQVKLTKFPYGLTTAWIKISAYYNGQMLASSSINISRQIPGQDGEYLSVKVSPKSIKKTLQITEEGEKTYIYSPDVIYLDIKNIKGKTITDHSNSEDIYYKLSKDQNNTNFVPYDNTAGIKLKNISDLNNKSSIYIGIYKEETDGIKIFLDSENVEIISDGVGVTQIEERYCLNNEATYKDGWTWTADIQTPTSSNKYLWNYEITYFGNGDKALETTPIIIAQYTEDGRSISKVENFYCRNDEATYPPNTKPSDESDKDTWDWNQSAPLSSTGTYLWNYELIKYDKADENGSTTFTTTPAIIGINGINGTSPYYLDIFNDTITAYGEKNTTDITIDADEISIVRLYQGSKLITTEYYDITLSNNNLKKDVLADSTGYKLSGYSAAIKSLKTGETINITITANKKGESSSQIPSSSANIKIVKQIKGQDGKYLKVDWGGSGSIRRITELSVDGLTKSYSYEPASIKLYLNEISTDGSKPITDSRYKYVVRKDESSNTNLIDATPLSESIIFNSAFDELNKFYVKVLDISSTSTTLIDSETYQIICDGDPGQDGSDGQPGNDGSNGVSVESQSTKYFISLRTHSEDEAFDNRLFTADISAGIFEKESDAVSMFNTTNFLSLNLDKAKHAIWSYTSTKKSDGTETITTPNICDSTTAVASWCVENNITQIDGSSIATGTITAAQINTLGLSANRILVQDSDKNITFKAHNGGAYYETDTDGNLKFDDNGKPILVTNDTAKEVILGGFKATSDSLTSSGKIGDTTVGLMVQSSINNNAFGILFSKGEIENQDSIIGLTLLNNGVGYVKNSGSSTWEKSSDKIQLSIGPNDSDTINTTTSLNINYPIVSNCILPKLVANDNNSQIGDSNFRFNNIYAKNINIDTSIIPANDNIVDIGTTSNTFKNIYCRQLGSDQTLVEKAYLNEIVLANKSITLSGDASTFIFNGSIEATSFTATSDKRLKENITPYECKKSILDLPVYKYNFINDETKKEHIGCLAQDLMLICPEIVQQNSAGHLTINENKIIYLLLDEVKKLKQEIEELKDNSKF